MMTVDWKVNEVTRFDLGARHSWQKSWLFSFLELSFWLFQNANIVKSQKPDFQVSRT
jgi:hypothetical protein